MADEAPFQDYPTYFDRSSGKSKIVLIFCLLFGLVICCLVGLYWLGSNSDRPTQVASVPEDMIDPTKVPAPTASPSATPAPLEKSDLTLAVLNGSGRVGAGRTVATYLKNLGYKVTVVGDARATASAGLSLKLTKEKEAYKSMLEKDLQGSPKVGSVSAKVTTTIDESITTDAEITVGR